ncbi:MAG: RcnB family protein [Caulobacteraceae bacterium]
MKRLATAVLAAATFAAPLAVSTPAAAQYRGDRDYDRDRDRGWDRDRDDDDRRDRRRYRRGDRDRDWDRDDRRDRGRHRGWDRRRHNGYWHGSRWYYGPPPAYWRDEARYDYRRWRRGDRLPSYYRSSYDEVDWRYHRLRAPPRGYHSVRDDRGDYLLVGIATGVILGIILANN